VVLPFSNLSGDPAQDYFADVLTDQLTTYLSRIPGSFVIARNTAFTYKGKPTDVKQIGRDLGVRYALEGSVQPTGGQVRVNAQLIDAESGAHLWAETFDHDRADLLQMEDDIVTRLARTLQIQLADIEAAEVRRASPGASPNARELTIRCQAAYLSIGQNRHGGPHWRAVRRSACARPEQCGRAFGLVSAGQRTG
jgi:adenylate cyclase